MASVPHSLGAVEGSHAVRGFHSRHLALGRTDEVSPFLDAVIGDQLEADDEVAADEVRELFKERFSLRAPKSVPCARRRTAGHH